MQVSFTVRGMWEHNSKKQKQKFITTESVWFHAMFGLIAFKVLVGRCRNMMPSNVIRPGAWARASIPARGSKYANETEANLIKDLFKQYGCHHCGTRHGQRLKIPSCHALTFLLIKLQCKQIYFLTE
jgi:hypothetical protein